MTTVPVVPVSVASAGPCLPRVAIHHLCVLKLPQSETCLRTYSRAHAPRPHMRDSPLLSKKFPIGAIGLDDAGAISGADAPRIHSHSGPKLPDVF